tara:strand:- start:2535 stop:3017 length:483 start_codon:yes stop_codon:yes gene_type:complete
MIQIESNKKESLFRITLTPNKSLSWKSNILFILAISVTCGVIGIAFYIAGAFLILPFAGLEIILVGTCVYLVVQRSYKQEIITLTPEKLKIEKGISKPNQFWEYFRIWAFVVVEKPKHPWYPAHIVITSKGERVPIGDFLTEKEKLDLVDKLRNIIDSLK